MPVKHVNFQRLIKKLKKHGLNQTQIARKVRCGQATISRLERDPTCQPYYDLGARLVALLESEND